MPLKKNTAVPFYEKLSLMLIGLIALGYLIVEGKELLDPLVFGFLFAILLLPIANFFEGKCRLPRSLAAFIAILLMLLFITGVFYLVGSQISKLTHDLPMLKKQVSQSVKELQEWIQTAFHIEAAEQINYINDTTKKIVSSGNTVLSTTFGAVSSLVLFDLFILIFTFFILFYRRLLLNFFLWVFNEENSKTVFDIIENIQTILRQYILGLLLEMIIVAGIACAAFWMIGIKYAALLGIIVALFNIIPYI